ncbi:hypothetical protein A2U01_0056968 [Trifolium medium]|uniref:Uncharacterized protein n=1 Tax=Trifolium medium TaxID=97028 RepID=A0A392RHQ0_9FABA|nr:hypothetical protein [Trifolium medium]
MHFEVFEGEDRPHFGDGVGTSAAGAEGGDEDADNAAADAFEDDDEMQDD